MWWAGLLLLNVDERGWVVKMKSQLEVAVTGKPLHYSWFREKKYHDKRLYFLVDEDKGRILFMAFASKKDQQDIIDFVVENKDELLGYLQRL
jgi:hypothetical protein